MSTVRVVVVASLAAVAIVAACTAPSSPADASSHAARMAHARRFSPLIACQDNTVEVNPCDGTDTLAKNSMTDTIDFTYVNIGSKSYAFDTDCGVDGVVVLSCTPEDSIFEVAAHHSMRIHYTVHTRATAGTGSIEATVDNLNTDDGTGSTVTIVTK